MQVKTVDKVILSFGPRLQELERIGWERFESDSTAKKLETKRRRMSRVVNVLILFGLGLAGLSILGMLRLADIATQPNFIWVAVVFAAIARLLMSATTHCEKELEKIRISLLDPSVQFYNDYNKRDVVCQCHIKEMGLNQVEVTLCTKNPADRGKVLKTKYIFPFLGDTTDMDGSLVLDVEKGAVYSVKEGDK